MLGCDTVSASALAPPFVFMPCLLPTEIFEAWGEALGQSGIELVEGKVAPTPFLSAIPGYADFLSFASGRLSRIGARASLRAPATFRRKSFPPASVT